MTRLIYIANIRLPTEKAHGLQIVQNCEAFAEAGADVALWVARRVNTRALRAVKDGYAYYGVKRNFTVSYLPTLDLLPLVPEQTHALARLIFYIQLLTFALSAALRLRLCESDADAIYSRDPLVLLIVGWLRPGVTCVYEAHQLAVGRLGVALQRRVAQQANAVVAITPRLRDDLLKLAGGAGAARFIVAHDGVRAGRFADLPSQAEARQALGWNTDAFIVGYVGRLHTLTLRKGLDTVISALAGVGDASLALVGGPDKLAAAHRKQWAASGLAPGRFIYAGQVPPGDVPLHLAAFDVCVMPHPPEPHFAYHTSPLKLFEYMAAGKAVVASELPSWADVVRHEENALLVPPSDVDAMAAAIRRLRDDPALRERLGVQARADALADYTWAARARHILAAAQIVPLPNP